MKVNKTKLIEAIDNVHEKWNMSGHFVLTAKDDILHRNYYGYENRLTQVKTSKESWYTLDLKHMIFLKIAALLAIDEKLLKFTDTIDTWIPEIKDGDQITIELLLREQTGLKDFYYDCLMVELENDQDHQQLAPHDRVRKECLIQYQQRSFEEVMKKIGSESLIYEPGKKDEFSESNAVVLAELLSRVLETDIYSYLEDRLFQPLKMSSVRKHKEHKGLSYTEYKGTERVEMPLDETIDGLIDVTIDDMIQLMMAFCQRQIFSEKLWKKILKYKEGVNDLLTMNASGYDCITIEFLGYGFYCYFNQKTGVGFLSLANEKQTFELVEDSWYYFRRELREIVSTEMTYPQDTQMVRLKKSHLWDALKLSIEKEQHKFVLEARSSVAMALMYSTKKAFVQMEGNLIVGLLVLDIDKKKDIYHIDIIIIDKKFQGRGYGKLMVSWAVEYLKTQGAKSFLLV